MLPHVEYYFLIRVSQAESLTLKHAGTHLCTDALMYALIHAHMHAGGQVAHLVAIDLEIFERIDGA